jgi:hypothetical protein
VFYRKDKYGFGIDFSNSYCSIFDYQLSSLGKYIGRVWIDHTGAWNAEHGIVNGRKVGYLPINTALKFLGYPLEKKSKVVWGSDKPSDRKGKNNESSRIASILCNFALHKPILEPAGEHAIS